mmetsp:Transcript_3414/g.7697  ORF Transcript_3414/g.7697 Transcript_3414/m.7697 type:complete len:127 (-) Transcript_3414:419-799(-)
MVVSGVGASLFGSHSSILEARTDRATRAMRSERRKVGGILMVDRSITECVRLCSDPPSSPFSINVASAVSKENSTCHDILAIVVFFVCQSGCHYVTRTFTISSLSSSRADQSASSYQYLTRASASK